MRIMLTDEEILDAIDKRIHHIFTSLSVMEAPAIYESIDACLKAQLKKIIKLFLDNCDDCDQYRPVYHFRLNNKTWQSLLKEIE